MLKAPHNPQTKLTIVKRNGVQDPLVSRVCDLAGSPVTSSCSPVDARIIAGASIGVLEVAANEHLDCAYLDSKRVEKIEELQETEKTHDMLIQWLSSKHNPVFEQWLAYQKDKEERERCEANAATAKTALSAAPSTPPAAARKSRRRKR